MARFPQQHMSIPNTIGGRLWLLLLRHYLGPRWTLRRRSRGVRPVLARLYLLLWWLRSLRSAWRWEMREYPLRYQRIDPVMRATGHSYGRPPLTRWQFVTFKLADLAHRMRHPASHLHDRTPLWCARRWGLYLVERPAALKHDSQERLQRAVEVERYRREWEASRAVAAVRGA